MTQSSIPSGLPAGHPFTPEQQELLNRLLPTLRADQMPWLNGFLAGFQMARAGQPVAPVQPAASESAPAPAEITILYGSESGNAEALAQKVSTRVRQEGFKPKVVNMADAKVGQLSQSKQLLVLVSTWGEGDPPSPAEDYYTDFMSAKAPRLKDTAFSVLALGDTSYEHFCKIGKDFDDRLATLGGRRLTTRVDCDVDYEADFQKWLTEVMTVIRQENQAPVAVAASPVTPAASPAEAVYDRKNPFPAILLENINLNSPASETLRGSSKETRHLEISLADSGLTYEPGDSLGIYPTNCPEVVDDIITLTRLDPEALVSNSESREVTLREALSKDYDITGLSQLFLKKYASLARSEHLDALLGEKDKSNLKSYLYGREISDTLKDFPVEALSPQDLVNLLRKMPPRLYSIASSLKAHPDEVHLTVATVRYQSNGKLRKGVCSTYLSDRVGPDDRIPVFVHHNKNFRLPTNPTDPIIMVGPGTGIAPFRAFVEERREIGASGKNWLFFGDQHFTTDFLYQVEWQQALSEGTLHRLDLAFSRDTDEKVYVQHRMKEKAADLWAWLQEGAYFYVCGDASRMAKDVHETLLQIAREQGGLSDDNAQDWLKSLQKEKRYQRDVY